MPRIASAILTLGAAVAAFAAPSRAVAQAAPGGAQPTSPFIGSAKSGAGTFADYYLSSPGTGGGTPRAFGLSKGDAFIGSTYHFETRGAKLPSGAITANGDDHTAISLGFGLGDANGGIGLTTVITSLETFKRSGGVKTGLSLHASHNITPMLAIGLGVENAATSGGLAGATESFYGVVTGAMQTPIASMPWLSTVTLTGGLGNGRFQFIDDANVNNDLINAFASVAAEFHGRASVIFDYTGQDLNIGMSVVPFPSVPLAIIPTLVDLTGETADRPRFALGLSLGMRF